MKRHCNRFLTSLCAAAATTLCAFAAQAKPAALPGFTSQAAESSAWIERIVEFLEIIYDILGGDSARLQQEPSLTGKLTLVASQYVIYGIPADLSQPEREDLADALDELYCLLDTPPADAPIGKPLAFLAVVRLMWLDLGISLSELGSF